MIITVAKISSELADQIHGQPIEGTSMVFNRVKDNDDNDIISLDEAQHLYPEQFTSIIWNPKPNEEI